VGVNHPFTPPPTCEAYPIAILLHDHCEIYAPPTDPLFSYKTPYHIGDGNIVKRPSWDWVLAAHEGGGDAYRSTKMYQYNVRPN